MSGPKKMSTAALEPIREHERIAVAICTKNRPGYLAALLGSLVNQTYSRWTLVLNDQSASPVREDDTVKDLLLLLDTRGHAPVVIRTSDAQARHQIALEAVPRGVELVLRVDDDVLLTPTLIEKILRPFRFFPDRPLAAVGPCLPEPHWQPRFLDPRLADPARVPRVDRPTFQLQGNAYTASEVIEAESLWGSAICYRRSAVEAVGGWTVPGQSEQIYREESDMSARLLAAGYELMVSTEALGWHLVAPSGGNRVYIKTPHGNRLASDKRPFDADDRLFRQRLQALFPDGPTERDLRRYRISDLEAGIVTARPLVSWYGWALFRGRKAVAPLLRPVRNAVRSIMARS